MEKGSILTRLHVSVLQSVSWKSKEGHLAVFNLCILLFSCACNLIEKCEVPIFNSFKEPHLFLVIYQFSYLTIIILGGV